MPITMPRVNITTRKLFHKTKHFSPPVDSESFCIACGFEQDGCEPDARCYECESCGEHKVYGAAELLLEVA